MIQLNGKDFKIIDPSVTEIITFLILVVGIVLTAIYAPHKISEILRLIE